MGYKYNFLKSFTIMAHLCINKYAICLLFYDCSCNAQTTFYGNRSLPHGFLVVTFGEVLLWDLVYALIVSYTAFLKYGSCLLIRSNVYLLITLNLSGIGKVFGFLPETLKIAHFTCVLRTLSSPSNLKVISRITPVAQEWSRETCRLVFLLPCSCCYCY